MLYFNMFRQRTLLGRTIRTGNTFIRFNSNVFSHGTAVIGVIGTSEAHISIRAIRSVHITAYF